MVANISFGHSTAILPDITDLMIGYGRGYAFKDFVAKIMDCGTRIHSTLKCSPWAPITYEQNMHENDERTVIPIIVIPNLLINHATLKSNRASGSETKLTVGHIVTEWAVYV